jgi:uncharacterized protein (DUF4415 family)
MMRFTFDPAKNERNMAERGLSFEPASELEWDTALIVEDTATITARRACGFWGCCMDGCRRLSSLPGRTSCASSASGRPTLKRKDYMSNSKPLDPERLDKDNPAWTRADIDKSRPASEVLPGLIGAKATDELLRRSKGRPPKEHRKVNQTLRIDPDVLEAYRQEGKGWQTHMNEVLRQNMPKLEK